MPICSGCGVDVQHLTVLPGGQCSDCRGYESEYVRFLYDCPNPYVSRADLAARVAENPGISETVASIRDLITALDLPTLPAQASLDAMQNVLAAENQARNSQAIRSFLGDPASMLNLGSTAILAEPAGNVQTRELVVLDCLSCPFSSGGKCQRSETLRTVRLVLGYLPKWCPLGTDQVLVRLGLAVQNPKVRSEDEPDPVSLWEHLSKEGE